MNTQFKKGVLELCVLSLLKRGDKYGYELADTVGKQIDVSEGTIYPLLKRLRAEGYFEVYLRESTSGPARKYYRLTQRVMTHNAFWKTSGRTLQRACLLY